ncbi:SDR family NAD(P)-dependent oxidoreductase [Ruegeria sp.]|uniref:SDR family NAD(P)-dependent oxidoreductase n=1 Tax=Ruegeria sp. TaxID=1879320 RepID=UPI003B5CFB9B
MSNTALITGASSGIGAEFARYHAQKGGDMVVVARRQEPLEALKLELEAAHNVKVTVIAQDVGTPDQAKALHQKLKDAGIEIDILINNAGFGGQGAFLDRVLTKDQEMIDLNISALVTLSHLIGNDMRTRGGGKMLQVSSTASFQPGPYQATYFATKAFVTSFSQAIDQEMRKDGITSTALCPGVVSTEFIETANLEGTGLSKQKAATPASVAKCGYDAMMKGELIAINESALSFVLNWLVPLMPRRRVLKMVESVQVK